MWKALKDLINRSKSEATNKITLTTETVPEVMRPLNENMKKTLRIFEKFLKNDFNHINGRELPNPIKP